MNIDIQRIISLFFKPAVTFSICGYVGQPYRQITTEPDWARAKRAARRLYREGYRSVCIVRKNAEHSETWHYDGYSFTKAQ